jgi:hypothetical protein
VQDRRNRVGKDDQQFSCWYSGAAVKGEKKKTKRKREKIRRRRKQTRV